MTPRRGWRFWAVLPGGWLRDPFREDRPLLVPRPTATCDQCVTPPGLNHSCGMYFFDSFEGAELRVLNTFPGRTPGALADEARYRYQHGLVITQVMPLGRVLPSPDTWDGPDVWRAASLILEAVSGVYAAPRNGHRVAEEVARLYGMSTPDPATMSTMSESDVQEVLRRVGL